MLATTPSRAKRADVVGMNDLDVRDVMPMVARRHWPRTAAWTDVQRPRRTDPSPIAWKWAWNVHAVELDERPWRSRWD